MFYQHSLPNTKKINRNANCNNLLTSKEFQENVLITLEISLPV